MAAGIHHAAEMILGNQTDFLYLSFRPDQSLDNLVHNLKEKIKEFDNESPCLVLVDLFGGTPANAIVQLLSEGYQLQTVTGVNLPMVIAALTERDLYKPEELVQEIRKEAADGIIDIVEKMMEE
jgi:PTS system mannose-specific IIA component